MNTDKHGINIDNLDPTVSPKEDFFLYACGGWKKKHPLTPEYSRFGMFDLLRENAREQLKELIVNLSEHEDAKKSGTVAQKVSDLYAMGMDEKKSNDGGSAPVQPNLHKIAGADTTMFE